MIIIEMIMKIITVRAFCEELVECSSKIKLITSFTIGKNES